jgi:crossover junction endodeoxyribonuclease RusA
MGQVATAERVDSATRSWTLVDHVRPWTANAERRWHYQKRAEEVRHARERWGWLAKAERIPAMLRISVEAIPVRQTRASWPDVAACYPAVKAAIDGLVDAGVVPDDNPTHVVRVTFHAPRIGDADGLRLVVVEEVD